MLVIHAVWLVRGRLAVWAEDPGVDPPPRRPGRPPRLRTHPFAAGLSTLRAALGDLAANGTTGEQSLRLPTRSGVPLDSPELVRPEPVPDTAGPSRPVRWAAWRVPVLCYRPDPALALLTALASGGVVGAAALPGASVRQLAEIATFAADLVARGRVLPVLDTGEARWRPLLTGADLVWARSLALALPPSAAAAADTAAADHSEAVVADPSIPVAEVTAAALDELTDAAARAALRGVRLTDNTRQSSGLDGTVRSWLRALTGTRRQVAGDPSALVTLDARLRDWQRDAMAGPVRACFRLIEPVPAEAGSLLEPGPDGGPGTDPDGVSGADRDGEPGTDRDGEPGAGPEIDLGVDPEADPGQWWLEFNLQATDEPSLLVGAEQIWAARGGLRALARHLDAPQETLLTELGRASRLWPELADALRTATPTGLALDVEGAHRFLREGAPTLHAAGFGVLLPSWWQRPGARLGTRLRASGRTAPGSVATGSRLGLDALVDYEWEVALGDSPLTARELRALAELKTPLVRLRGQWVELDPRRLAAGLRLLRTGGALTVAELLRLGLDAPGEDDGLPVLEVSADGALGDLLAGRLDATITPLDEPPDFTGALRPYQKWGLAWLSFLQALGLGGVLADDMGLGKTVQLLALLAADPPQAGPTLLVCPVSLVGNWQREAARFAPHLRVHVHHGTGRARGGDLRTAVEAADLVLTTYPIAARDTRALGEIDWHRVIADEAQAIKNAATRQANAIRSLPARHRIAVTGTPVENRLADLWSIMEFVNPGLLGPATTFRKRYAEPIERHGDEEAAGRLRRMTSPFVLRRLKTDPSVISDLPEKLEMDVLCNLTAEQASLYQAVVDDMLERIEHSAGIERRGLVLATMTRLKQVCNHPAQLLRDGSALTGRSGKLARVEETIEEILAAGEQALLFTQYAGFGALLRSHLVARFGREVLFLHGGVGKRDRDAMVTRFQAGDPALFILSLKAGGTGLTLTAASHVLHVDRWWNPAVEDQATDRAFRIGQRRNVQVRKFVCAGTVEEKIAELIGGKRGLAERIVGTGEQWLTELSTAELRQLVALEAGAVTG